ncbi:LuxR C-terminal-related transcriptional regulator [Pantoea sp. Taur]|uniref:response regulator transcription factor n=1 Tax=Pantoea sp. Taur TaxID=2576757 RepID=UPI0013540C1B|nr:response regulator transcription factor [Pantoea sp. Taur]MXP57136.1 response regulator transcription factor [Pantoea sp. Taur]
MRVIIYDGHPLMRDGLTQLVSDRGHMIISATSNASQLLQAAHQKQPDLIILDPVTLPAAILDKLNRPYARGKRLSCFVYSGSRNAELLLRGEGVMMQGSLSKHFSDEALHEAVDGLAKGIAAPLPLTPPGQRLGKNGEADLRVLQKLTRRELQILCRLGAGKSNKEIAAEMKLSNKTISTYKRSIMLKMQTESLGELIDLAQRNGF